MPSNTTCNRPARFKAAIVKLGVELKNGKLELMDEVDGASAASAPVTPTKMTNGAKGDKGSKRKAKDVNDSAEYGEADTPESNKKLKADSEIKEDAEE
jgi:hypothetical protein